MGCLFCFQLSLAVFIMVCDNIYEVIYMQFIYRRGVEPDYANVTKLIVTDEVLDEGFFTDILPRFARLESLIINTDVKWRWLKNADLARLKMLYLTTDGVPTFPLKCDNLAVLSIVVKSEMEDYSREELYAIDRRRYDFSHLKNLTFLRISGWYSLDYRSFAPLSNLRELVINDRGSDDLSWLSESYSLSALTFSGNLISLSGIETQPELEYLHLAGNFISDVSPLDKLTKLKEVDLKGNPLK